MLQTDPSNLGLGKDLIVEGTNVRKNTANNLLPGIKVKWTQIPGKYCKDEAIKIFLS